MSTRILWIGTQSGPPVLRATLEVTPARDPHTALDQMKIQHFDAVVWDVAPQGLDPLVLNALNGAGSPVVLIVDSQDESNARHAVTVGVEDYVLRDRMDAWSLERILDNAVEMRRLQRELGVANRRVLEVTNHLETLPLIDPLTELYNRRGLEDILSREIHWAQRDGTGLTVLLVDLDDFKQINETLGHAVGDVVLQEIARKLRTALRATDYAARVGGDEFLVLLPQTRPAEGMWVAEKTRLALSGAPITLSSGPVEMTASLGVISITEKPSSIDELLTKTRMELSKSKKAGKNRVSYNGGRPWSSLADHPTLAGLFHFDDDQPPFRSVAQPIYRLSDQQPVGYELLSRTAPGVFEMPDDFFRVSLEAKILTLVDYECFKTCIESQTDLPSGRRHINIFPSTLIDVPVARLLELVPEDVRPSLCIEISEQQIIGDPSYLLEPVEALKHAGLTIAVDDVGFGRSCLESLILLEPDVVKIDKRCVRGIANDRAQARSLKRLLKVALSLGAEVIAEGIEESDELEVLKDLGVQFGQGYLWGKPAPIKAFAEPEAVRT